MGGWCDLVGQAKATHGSGETSHPHGWHPDLRQARRSWQITFVVVRGVTAGESGECFLGEGFVGIEQEDTERHAPAK